MSSSSEFSVVGIGASAGGITALQTLFHAIPTAPNLAFVVVQHLTPDQPSQLARLFGSWTTLHVREAAAGVELQPGWVYVAPPGVALGLDQGAFTTRPPDAPGFRSGIDSVDFFFEQLANELGPRAVAVILSGTGSDGAAGAVRVKQAGGLVLVQDPTTAMHDGMPNAVIENGTADHILPLVPLAQELLACAAPDYVRSPTAPTWADEVTKALDSMIALIRAKAGFDLSGYKTTPLLWRIQRRMQLRRVPLFRDYEALLHDDSAELESLVRGMPIHVTEFFRDAHVWQLLEQDVIPELFATQRDAPVRAWTTACSSGEEAYSLAMLLAESAGGADFQVFATDASAEIVALAGRGIFKTSAVVGLPVERRSRFFYAVDGAHRVKRSLREKMVFALQDLLADPPFSGLDLVTCRNLLIYLEPEAAAHVIYLLHSALRMGGYLVLGKSESTLMHRSAFEELAPNVRIYRKIGPVHEGEVAFPKRPARMSPSLSSHHAAAVLSSEVALVESDLPAVLVDGHFQIVRVYGDTSTVLHFRPGEPSTNLLDLVPPEIATHLPIAAREAQTHQHAVMLGRAPLQVRITPLASTVEDGPRTLVAFLRAEPHDLADTAEPTHAPGGGTWSEALRLSHAELDASREELQALNEELRASNDQLNFSNEELNRANAQLRDKLVELETQSHVLSSGGVVMLFLDEELRMRFYTPGVSELFPVRTGDVGRRVTDLVPKFDYPPFLDDVQRVMQTGQPSEAEVRTTADRWYIKRIRPFRGNNGARAGVAITFTDITDRKSAQDALDAPNERMTKLVGLMPAGVYTCDAEGVLTFYNQRAVELWGREPDLRARQEKFCGSLRMCTRDGTLVRHEDCPMADALRHGVSARDLEVIIEQPTGARIVTNVNIDPLYDREGRIAGAINVFVDVTDRRTR